MDYVEAVAKLDEEIKGIIVRSLMRGMTREEISFHLKETALRLEKGCYDVTD